MLPCEDIYHFRSWRWTKGKNVVFGLYCCIEINCWSKLIPFQFCCWFSVMPSNLLAGRGPCWTETLNVIKSQKHKKVKHPHFLWCTHTSFIFLKGRCNQKQKIICTRTRFCFLLNFIKLLHSIDGKIHCQKPLLNPNKILIMGEFSEIASSVAYTEKQPSLRSTFMVVAVWFPDSECEHVANVVN